jgi:hypothetical protein
MIPLGEARSKRVCQVCEQDINLDPSSGYKKLAPTMISDGNWLVHHNRCLRELTAMAENYENKIELIDTVEQLRQLLNGLPPDMKIVRIDGKRESTPMIKVEINPDKASVSIWRLEIQ